MKKYEKVTDISVGKDLPRLGDTFNGFEIISIAPTDSKPHKIKIRHPKP